MNEFDQWMKHTMRVQYYARYTDDFVIVSSDVSYLKALLPRVADFIKMHLRLKLHPNKIEIRKLHRGIDFLGYVVRPYHILVRTKTRRRIWKKLRWKIQNEVPEEHLYQSLNSYLGVLKHADAHRLSEKLKNQIWFWRTGR